MCTSCGNNNNWDWTAGRCGCGCTTRGQKGEPGIQGATGADGAMAPTYSIAFTLVANTPLTITHGLGTLDLVYQCRSGNNNISVDFVRVDINNITLTSPVSVSGNIIIKS